MVRSFFFLSISQHLPYRIRAVGLENLLKVRGNAVAVHAAVTEHRITGLPLRNGLDGFLRHIMVKAGQQEPFRHVKHLFPRHFFHFDGAGKEYAQVQHDLEQQVLRRAVGLDVIDKVKQIFLLCIFRRIVHILHIALTQAQAAETDIQICRHGQPGFLLDLASGTADMFLADFADIFITRLVCCSVFICAFRNLSKNKLAMLAFFSIKLHKCMSRCRRSSIKIQNPILSFSFFNS